MSNSTILTESEFRQLSFARAETHVTSDGEVDIFLPDGWDEGPEIRIDLAVSGDGSRREELCYNDMSVLTFDGEPLVLQGQDGRRVDPEMIEVIAWELIDGLDAIPGIMEGRKPVRQSDGVLAKIGTVHRWMESQPDTEMSFS